MKVLVGAINQVKAHDYEIFATFVSSSILVVVVVVGRGMERLEGQRHPAVGLRRGGGEAGVLQRPYWHAHLVQGRLHGE